jgi:siroheme synthase (precorrin-2 oxidase/ferrochelatase)
MTSAPGFSRFRQQTVLLVGSGSVAVALMQRLLAAGARVRWLSQDVDVAEEIWLSGRPGRIEIAFRAPRVLDFEEAAAVIATVGEPIASAVAAQARALRRPVAVLGRPELSTFDLDDTDGGGSGDIEQSWLGAPLRRVGAWFSDRLASSMTVLASLPRSFGA